MSEIVWVAVAFVAYVMAFVLGRREGRAEMLTDPEIERAVDRGIEVGKKVMRRRLKRAALDPGVQLVAHERRHSKHEHEPEILDGVETCIVCGAVKMPDGPWIYEYATPQPTP